MTLAEFRSSLAKVRPPRDVSTALAALWWAAKGDWERAHKLVHMSDIDREVIIRYLTRDFHVVFSGDLAPPKK